MVNSRWQKLDTANPLTPTLMPHADVDAVHWHVDLVFYALPSLVIIIDQVTIWPQVKPVLPGFKMVLGHSNHPLFTNAIFSPAKPPATTVHGNRSVAKGTAGLLGSGCLMLVSWPPSAVLHVFFKNAFEYIEPNWLYIRYTGYKWTTVADVSNLINDLLVTYYKPESLIRHLLTFNPHNKPVKWMDITPIWR